MTLPAIAGAQTNLFPQGNPERPAVEVGSFLPVDVGERLGAYVGYGHTGNVTWVSSQYTTRGFSFPAEIGAQWINLGGVSGTETGVSIRPIATTKGASYTLSFYVGNVVDPTGPFGTTSTIKAYQGTTYLGSATNSSGGTTLTWTQATFHFTATGPWTQLRFLNADPPGDLICGLDNIVLTQDGGDRPAATPVVRREPEPASPAPSAVPENTAPKTVYNFQGKKDGATPRDGMAIDAAGNLYGLASVSGAENGGVIYEVTPGADGGPGSEQTLYAFSQASGTFPNGIPVFDSAGALYGTTHLDGPGGAGTVWKLTPQKGGGWSFAVIYGFTGGDDGGYPAAGVIIGDDGAVYGMTQRGGKYKAGVAYRLVPNQDGTWSEQVMHDFAHASDGGSSVAALLEGPGRVFYGTTTEGGSGGAGTVFSLTLDANGVDWDLATLWSFDGGTDGGNPSSSLIIDAKGVLYGTAQFGGPQNGCPDGEWYWYGDPAQPGSNIHNGCGVVFQLAPANGGSWAETVLWNFTGGRDGSWPNAQLAMGADGTLYSTTPVGGTQDEGKLFSLQNSGGKWVETPLVTLEASNKNGFLPRSGVTIASDGTLYVASSRGGNTWVHVKNDGYGTVFSYKP